MKALVFLSFLDSLFSRTKIFYIFFNRAANESLEESLDKQIQYLYNSGMWLTKSGSISKNPKVALCGFKVGRSKLH